jgi:hypothetical protein
VNDAQIRKLLSEHIEGVTGSQALDFVAFAKVVLAEKERQDRQAAIRLQCVSQGHTIQFREEEGPGGEIVFSRGAVVAHGWRGGGQCIVCGGTLNFEEAQ